MRVFFSIVFLVAVAGALTMLGRGPSDESPQAGQFDRYFPTPSAAVKTTADLLKTENWSELATYYDLTGTVLDRTDLTKEGFFIETDAIEEALSEELEAYKQPFSPGFEFQSARSLGNDIIEVTVITEIIGDDDTVQQGLDTFLLKAHPEGYQLLPKED